MSAQLIFSSQAQAFGSASRSTAKTPVAAPAKIQVRRISHVASASKSQAGRWKGMDAGQDTSDDQQDIARGRQMVDSLFQGNQGLGGTHNAILSSQDYISQAQRSFNNIADGFYISPAFLDKISIHIAKNFMDLPKIKVPLILGIWGGKGQGKTFQCMLAFKKLGINPIVMSAGELESGNAGEPAKLIRQRYREASDIIKKGKMAALFINDLDAGAGRFGLSTQYTVNNQMVNATLMNIADNPTNVQLPGVYKNDNIPRVPIICTGNDFSTLYAPLIRDGRMEKFYWNPTREDRIGVCMGIFAEDGLTNADVEKLVDSFPGQSIDFFGALRARVYDDKIRSFVSEVGIENIGSRLVNSKKGKVSFDKPKMDLDILMHYGRALVEEQDNVKRVQLADSYLSGAELAGSGGSSVPEAYQGLRHDMQFKQHSRKSTPVPVAAQSPAPVPRSSQQPASGAFDRSPSFGASAPERGRSSTPVPPRSSAPLPAARQSSAVVDRSSPDWRPAGQANAPMDRHGSRPRSVSPVPRAASPVPSFRASSPAPAQRSSSGVVDRSSPDWRPSGQASPPADRHGSRPRSVSPAPRSSSPAPSYRASSPAPSFRASSPAPAQRSGTIDRSSPLWRPAGQAEVQPDRHGSRPRSASPAPRAASPAPRSSSPAPSFRASSPARSSGGADKLSASDLSALKIDDLSEVARKRGLTGARIMASRDTITKALIDSGASLADLTRSALLDLSTKFGLSPGRDADKMRSALKPLIGKSGGGSSSPAPSSASWRPSSAPASSPAPAASWSKSPSPAAGPAGGSDARLSTSDLTAFRIDDLQILASKKAVSVRNVDKKQLISELAAAGVSLGDLSRGQLIDLSIKLGQPLGKDIASLKKTLSSVVGRGGSSGGSSNNSYSSPAPRSSSPPPPSWRKTASPAAAPAPVWQKSANNNHSASNNGASSGGNRLSFEDLQALKIDDLRELCSKKGVSPGRSATKDSLMRDLASAGVSLTDLSRGQLVDLSVKLGQPLTRDPEALRRNLSGVIGRGGASAHARAPAMARR